MSHHGTGAFIPREVLDPKPSREERQRNMTNRMETLETKFNSLVEELTKHKDAAVQIAQKNQLIDDLSTRVRALEDLVTRRSGGKDGDFRLHVASAQAFEKVNSRLEENEKEMRQVRGEMGELMFVYDDVQDRLYDLDRTWKNNLAFYGIKLDQGGLHESPGCLEAKIRHVLKNKLNIGREIVIMRCHRVFNGVDSKGNKPIVVNFQKWSDKEEVLRKAKILKNGSNGGAIWVEEDFSRAAKHRRRELEKLVKEIRAVDPDRKCHFKYDKLIVDDVDVFVYNDVERRIERLPHTVAGTTSSLDHENGGVNGENGNNNTSLPLLHEDTPSATLGRHRNRSHTTSGLTPPNNNSNNSHHHLSSPRPAWRTKSVESILGKIPDVSSSTLSININSSNSVSNNPTAAVMRALTASVSTPSLVARERARASAREKMTPNFQLDNDRDNANDEALVIAGERVELSDNDLEDPFKPEQEDDDNSADEDDENRQQQQSENKPNSKEKQQQQINCQKAFSKNEENKQKLTKKRHQNSLSNNLTASSRAQSTKSLGGMSSLGGNLTEDEEEDYLPLNNVVDWDEWSKIGECVPPKKKRDNRGKGNGEPKLKSKYAKKGVGSGSKSGVKAKGSQVPAKKKAVATATRVVVTDDSGHA